MMGVARALVSAVLVDEMFRCKEGIKNDTDESEMLLFIGAKLKVESDRVATFKEENDFFKSIPDNPEL